MARRFAPILKAIIAGGLSTYEPGDILIFKARTAEQYEQLAQAETLTETIVDFAFGSWTSLATSDETYAATVREFIKRRWADAWPKMPDIVYSATVVIGSAHIQIVGRLTI